MIKNYKQFNESLRDLMVGPTKDEVWDSYMKGKLKGLITSIPESPEDFFNQMKEGCVEDRKTNHGIVYSKNGINLFQMDSVSGHLYVNYKYIWSTFENVYVLNKDEIKKLINKELVNDKWSGLNPSSYLTVDEN